LVRGLVNEATAWLSAGDLAECEACAAEASTLAGRLEDLMAIASLVALRGQVALARGDLDTAVSELQAASGELGWEEIHSRLFRLHLADALVQAGRPADAAVIVDDVLSAASPADMAWLVAQPTLAAIRAAEGDVAAAGALVEATRRELDERGFAWSLVVDRLDRAASALAAPTRAR
jgi:ATP/maltotriose-dependent transcriptional regulator MalT